MVRFTIALLSGLLFVPLSWAQAPTRELTRPVAPSKEALNRLNLTLAWANRVRIESSRDGLLSAQILPYRGGTQIIVQTLAGRVIAYNGETGDQMWARQVGEPYWAGQLATFTSDSLFIVRREQVYALNRFTGDPYPLKQINERALKAKDGFTLPFTPSSAPAIEQYLLEFRLYFVFGNRAMAYRMPNIDAIQRLTEQLRAQGKSLTEFQQKLDDIFGGTTDITELWTLGLDGEFVTQPPVLYGDLIGLATSTGSLKLYLKENPAHDFSRGGLDFRFPVVFRPNGTLSAPLGQYFRQAYLGSSDATLYGISLESGNLDWRFQTPGTITRRPESNDTDLFAVVHGAGLIRIDRAKGREKWRNQASDRFLAVNQDYVYTLDRIGRLQVLDGMKGTLLSGYDASEWKVPIPNEWTDRIYLANHDGQLLCLRHQANVKPKFMRQFEEPIPVKKKDKAADVMEEKKDDEKKDEKKDDKAASVGDGARPEKLSHVERLHRPLGGFAEVSRPRCVVAPGLGGETAKRASTTLAWG